MKIGEALKELRGKKKLTQDELADLVGSTAANISRIENGKHGASVDLLNSIAYVFNLKVYQLIAMAEGYDASEDMARFTPDEITVITTYRSLNFEQKNLIKNTLDVLARPPR